MASKSLSKTEAVTRMFNARIVAVQMDEQEVKIETDRGDVLIIRAHATETVVVSVARLMEIEVAL